MTKDQPQLFISCGQLFAEERQLGADIYALVKEVTPFEPYFAEFQSSAEGLSQNILKALDRAIAFIAVLHPRGTVHYSSCSEHVRASVWIEQEIAIAAYITQVAGKDLKVRAYVHSSVKREGMREQLALRPIEFSQNAEILADLAKILPDWAASYTSSNRGVEVGFSSSLRRIEGQWRYFQLSVNLQNNSNDLIENYTLDLQFPSNLLEATSVNGCEVNERRTPSHRVFRVTQDTLKRKLFPGDPIRAFTLDYVEDRGQNGERSIGNDETVVAKLFIPNQKPTEARVRVVSLHDPNHSR